jgi:outer membrane protein assembly factor BamB
MNILTPTMVGEEVFTSSYGNKAWLYKVSLDKDRFRVAESWTSKTQAYMSSPVIIDGHAYLHLQNQRFTCLDLKTGNRTWTSDTTFGQYWSMVAQGKRILALDQNGELLLIQANPKELQIIDRLKVGKNTWAHLAVCGNEVFVRELNALAVYRWQKP